MKRIFCILAFLCPYLYGLAQPIPSNQQGLQPGDHMPDVMLNKLYNHSVSATAFSAFQKELTIVDFWATWCGACIGSFPKMHELQAQFKDKLRILMVNASTNDDEKKVANLFNKIRAKTGAPFTLPYILNDTVFFRLFPYRELPHYVWIDGESKVLAITESSDVTAANIERYFNGKLLRLGFKDDSRLLAEGASIAEEDTGINKPLILQRSLLTAAQKGRGSKMEFDDAGKDKVAAVRIMNYPLLAIYKFCNPIVFKNGGQRLIIDSSIAHFFSIKDEQPAADYCYELQTSPGSRTVLMEQMHQDLQRYFKVMAIAENKMTDCIILKAGSSLHLLRTKGGEAAVDFSENSIRPHIINSSLSKLAKYIEIFQKKAVIDETGFTEKVDIIFPKGFANYNLEQMEAFFNSIGIVMQQEQRLLTVPRLKALNN